MVINFRYYTSIIIVSFFLSFNIGYAQSLINCGKEGVEKIDCAVRITGGGSVDYRINSLTKYNEGVEYDSWTRLDIYFEDDPDDPNSPTGKNWRLEFKALSTEIIGDGGRTLDLDYITLEIVGIFGEIGVGTNHLEQTLEDDYKPLISNADQGKFTVFITYKIGKDPAKVLLGEYPGYFVTDIRFKLSAE